MVPLLAGSLRQRIQHAERELADLDRGAGDAATKVQRRLALQQELDAARPMVRQLEQRAHQAVGRRRRREPDAQHVEFTIQRLRRQIEEQRGRIQRHRRLVEEAESTAAGHRVQLGRLENQPASLQSQLVRPAGAELE